MEKVKRNIFVYAILGILIGSASGCYYSHDHYDRGHSLRSWHDDTDHRIDQD
jgi:hypothetical protein